MQTFLPYKDFDKSAHALDSKRLNKQILEGYQIMNVLMSDDPRAGWRNHPAVKMWRGHENALFEYIMAMIAEADRRGIKTDKNKENLIQLRVRTIERWGNGRPSWYGSKSEMARVTATHKANLYRKDPDYYHGFVTAVTDKNNEPCCERCNYYWVTHLAPSSSVLTS
jgi:hypothetical protein